MTIELLDYQKEAVKLAVKIPYHMIAVQTGKGKSLISVFYTRYLLNKKLADKVILCSTKTGVNSFKKAFGKRVGYDVPQYDNLEDVLNFFSNDEKICIIKHSIVEKLGFDQNNINCIRNTLTNNYKRIAIVLDEVHKFSNDTSNLHQAFMNIRFAFERISVQTATPFGSELTQLYGIIHLIYPKLWKNKREFINNYIEEKVIIDYRTKRVKRKEIVSYHHLNELRNKISSFTYFYFPPLDLTFVEHKTRLKDYTDYDNMCKGVLSLEDLKDGDNNGK